MRIPFRQTIGQIRTFAAALTAQRFLASQNGSAALPTIRPGTDADTGFYYDATKGLVVAVDGIDRIMSRTNGENRIVSAASRGTPIAAIYNAVGNTQFFVSDASPEGVVTANPGNWCTDATAGTWYKKQTGTGNTGWREVSPSVSGTWTPTISATVNLDSASWVNGRYVRVGDFVICGGAITIDPTATGTVSYELTPPITTNFSTAYQCSGICIRDQTDPGRVLSNATNDTLAISLFSNSTAASVSSLICIYQVL